MSPEDEGGWSDDDDKSGSIICSHIHPKSGQQRRSRYCEDCGQLINSKATAPETCYISHIEMTQTQRYCGDCGNKL